MRLSLLLLPALAFAQADWTLPPQFRSAGYTRTKEARGYRLSGPGPKGAMTQTLAAGPFRGAPVRLRAAVRVEGEGSAQLILRVDRENGELGFFDNMGDRPIRAGEWAIHELTGEVAKDARTIEIGVLSSGKADVVVDEVSFEKLPAPPPAAAAARDEIAAHYAGLDDAYAQGNVKAIAALAAPDAQLTIPGGRIPISTALAQIAEQMKRGVTFRSRSVITAFRLSGGDATVWVNNESTTGASGVLSCNRDTWTRTPAGWRLTGSTLIDSRSLTPGEALSEIQKRSGMPDWKDVRIVLWQGADAPPLPGFTIVRASLNRAEAAAAAVEYLKQHAPEEAGPAVLAYQREDPARMAAVVRAFDTHRANTAAWAAARQNAVLAYQLSTKSPEEALASHVIWLASEASRDGKFLVVTPNAAGAAPLVRNRYGKQVYVVGAVPREVLGGEYFIDVARVPPESALGVWLAAQKFPFDGVAGR